MTLINNFAGSVLSDWIAYIVIIIAGTYIFMIWERGKKEKEKRQNELLELERNVSTFNNHLLGCTYDFALKTITAFYHDVIETTTPEKLRLILACSHDEYGCEQRLEWLFQKINQPVIIEHREVHKKKEVCVNHFITLPTERAYNIYHKKRNGIECILHPEKEGESTLQMIYKPTDVVFSRYTKYIN